MADLTPMMQQYHNLKNKYNDTILFYRLGDFYEMFGDDAKTAAKLLDIALTARNKGGGEKTPMAGVPHHSADSYIAKLINNGYKVAICEQIEDAAEASGIVDRDVIRVITPGTVIENEILNDNENNYLTAAIRYKDKVGFSFADISTGEFYLTEFPFEQINLLWDELHRIAPRELIINNSLKKLSNYKEIKDTYNFTVNKPIKKDLELIEKKLKDHFKVKSLAGFGCQEMFAATQAAGEILFYLSETQKRSLAHINRLQVYRLNDFMVLDSATRRNLELTTTIRDNSKNGSLLDIIDKTITSMGGRLIKKWINQPLINLEEIRARQGALEEIQIDFMQLNNLRDELTGIYDLERILGKITYQSANARDLVALKSSLGHLPIVENYLENFSSELLKKMRVDFENLEDIFELLDHSLINEPPTQLTEGGIIADGYHEKLDKLRNTTKQGKDWIASLQKQEKERTGISSLKVGFNKVFGYYIEVTNANLDKVPDDYQRKQTLTNSERYIIPELKEKEALVLGAEEKIKELEYNLFVEIRDKVGQSVERIKTTAHIIAVLDVLAGLAILALENNYTLPQINQSDQIIIKQGRHPVVEKMLDGNFVPNDTFLNRQEDRFILITGPNMSGKSTYMRQVALIVLMAQIGSFIPAESAEIGLTDRIFTRVGASDDLTTGQSTFMVEMNEVANIVNNSTEKSLIILDEVGRGTSTYDGVSIAWAVSEYINNPERIGARTLFATHYHELTRLEEEYNGVKNYNVLVEEDNSGVHFLHKIIPGRADQSYGIEVARLAGLPDEIIINAQHILDELESKSKQPVRKKEKIIFDKKHQQLPLFQAGNSILKKIDEQDLLNMTPMEAMNFLYKLQQDLKEERN